MKWMLAAMHDEYGKSRWNKMSQEDQLNAIAGLMDSFYGAIKILKHYNKSK